MSAKIVYNTKIINTVPFARFEVKNTVNPSASYRNGYLSVSRHAF
jgi:hypothetical protein